MHSSALLLSATFAWSSSDTGTVHSRLVVLLCVCPADCWSRVSSVLFAHSVAVYEVLLVVLRRYWQLIDGHKFLMVA